MNQKQARRLVTLAKHLATIPANYFNLSTFVSGREIENKFITNARLENKYQACSAQQLVEVNCGTTACALGWGATIPEFVKEGLKLEINVSTGWVSDRSDIYGDVVYEDQQGDVFENFEAADEFFGLASIDVAKEISYGDMYIDNVYESFYLFDPTQYDTNKRSIADVIQRIADVLQNHKYPGLAKQVRQFEWVGE